MDKITKALNKLSDKERAIIKRILINIKDSKYQDLDIKKLKSRGDIYRARKGKIRIIFKIDEEQITILAIERRSDTTYNF